MKFVLATEGSLIARLVIYLLILIFFRLQEKLVERRQHREATEKEVCYALYC